MLLSMSLPAMRTSRWVQNPMLEEIITRVSRMMCEQENLLLTLLVIRSGHLLVDSAA
jgi:hypothetical protein